MPPKRKDKGNHHDTPTKNKRIRQEKTGDFSDDEDLSDIDDVGEIFNGIRIPPLLPPIVSADDNLGPRMVIKNIVAKNFKSYYGEVKIGPFHKSLSSIVGANGSGKSNVIDSLLFVFGYRSTKIRSKKVSVLLHKSDQHKDVTQCSVTVNFVHIRDDNSVKTGFVALPGSEITITRTAFKDNTSFYTLNNKRVKFKDIATMLKKNGIDLIHNRFLILQGEVEQIAMMKPKAENEHSTGMLEYLEDVIGTVRYKKPIAQLEEKVQELSLEKNEKTARVKFFRKERDELLEAALNVIEYLKLKNQNIALQNKFGQCSLHKSNKEKEQKIKILNEKKDKLISIENELTAIAESKTDITKQSRSLSEKLKKNFKEYESLEKKYKNLLNTVEPQLKSDIILTNNQIKKCENSIKQEQNKITKAKEVPKIKETELECLKSQLAPLEEECTKLEVNYTKVNSSGFEKSKKFREEKDKLAPEELKLQKLVGSKQNQFQTLKTEFEVLLDTEKSEKEKLSKLEEQMIKGADDFQENMKKKEKAEVDIRNSRDTIKELEKNIEKLKMDEQQMKTNLKNIQQSLTEKRTAYAETTERSRPIQYILNLKEQGKISGILGRCGDYGQVEGKFDIPASTACGSTDQIVVETTAAAHACIQSLRTNKIGRLTFSILPELLKLKPRADAKNKYPENAKRVFDLIEILDQRFRLTFYSGLYDTLLAEDLEQARRIAFGTQTRYRVVTYKGDLIDQSGIMSGGGRQIKGKIGPQETKSRYVGGNSSQVSQNEVEKLDKIASDLEINLRETQSKIYDFQANIEQHHRLIEELNVIVRQCLSRINMWKEKENQVKNLIEAQKLVIVQKKTDPIAVANKEAEIKKAEKELEDAKLEYSKIKSKVDKLKQKIEEITEGEPKEAKRLLDEATKKLEKTRNGINQVNIDKLAAERQIKKSEGQIETLKNDVDELKEKLKTIHENVEKNQSLIEEYSKKLDAMKINNDEKSKELKEFNDKIHEGSQRNNELLKKQIILKQELDETNEEVKISKEKCRIEISKLSSLKLEIIPKIDTTMRDTMAESLKTPSTESQKTTIFNGESDKNNTDRLQEKDNDDEMQVDDEDREDAVAIENGVLPQYTVEKLEKFDFGKLEMDYVLSSEILKNRPYNPNMLEEYQKRTKQYNEKADDLVNVLRTYHSHVEMANKVRQRRRDEFMVSFKKIKTKLKEMYQMITLGGDAELELTDSLDPFIEGITFSVRPPKKTWKVITNLSGGEKTLSSLALVFALHYYKPSPLYVMDEIDAALDFKNVSIIAYYIKERTKNSQFIIISLRSNMFEKANLLVGIYKTNDCTKSAHINTDTYNELLKKNRQGCLYKYHTQKNK